MTDKVKNETTSKLSPKFLGDYLKSVLMGEGEHQRLEELKAAKSELVPQAVLDIREARKQEIIDSGNKPLPKDLLITDEDMVEGATKKELKAWRKCVDEIAERSAASLKVGSSSLTLLINLCDWFLTELAQDAVIVAVEDEKTSVTHKYLVEALRRNMGPYATLTANLKIWENYPEAFNEEDDEDGEEKTASKAIRNKFRIMFEKIFHKLRDAVGGTDKFPVTIRKEAMVHAGLIMMNVVHRIGTQLRTYLEYATSAHTVNDKAIDLIIALMFNDFAGGEHVDKILQMMRGPEAPSDKLAARPKKIRFPAVDKPKKKPSAKTAKAAKAAEPADDSEPDDDEPAAKKSSGKAAKASKKSKKAAEPADDSEPDDEPPAKKSSGKAAKPSKKSKKAKAAEPADDDDEPPAKKPSKKSKKAAEPADDSESDDEPPAKKPSKKSKKAKAAEPADGESDDEPPAKKPSKKSKKAKAAEPAEPADGESDDEPPKKKKGSKKSSKK